MAGVLKIESRDLDRLRKKWGQAGERMLPLVKEATEKVAKEVVDLTVRNKDLKNRSGDLESDLKDKKNITAVRKGLKFEVEIGFRKVPYGPIHEFGGTIKGKPLLSVPLGRARDAGYKSTREAGPLVRRTSSAGKILLIKPGEGPLFVMKEQVTLKPRLGLRKSADSLVKGTNSRLAKELGFAIKEFVKRK